MELYIILAVLYFPFFIWLSLTYIKYSKDAVGDSKRKSRYMGFLLTIIIFNIFNNMLLELEDSVGLFIISAIILFFSVYMLRVIVKDKRRVLL